MRDAFDGLRRFAKNILSARLRNLVAHGIMDTMPATDGSPYQDYVPRKVAACFRCWSR